MSIIKNKKYRRKKAKIWKGLTEKADLN